jgi:hypothetical protein
MDLIVVAQGKLTAFGILIDNSTFPLLSFLSDGNTEVKDERCPFIRYALPVY